ncbi:hypothetical protein C8Q79DRAFT_1006135 [Trametes meyenii]|nr:hypothetical protein C8Q79DRAFT_1006135 [Trametes meyenii]
MPEGPVTDGIPPVRGFTVSKKGVEVAVQYKPYIDFDRQGASLQIRLPITIVAFPLMVDPLRMWGEWQPLTEVFPVVQPVGDSGGKLRVLHLTLKHHSGDLYLLGIEPLEWDLIDQIRTVDAEEIDNIKVIEHSDPSDMPTLSSQRL